MDAVTASIFGKLYQQYGIIGALLVVAAILLLLRGSQYAAVRIEMMRQDATDRRADINVERGRADKAAADLHILMTNHLAHDKMEREESVKVLTIISENMKSVHVQLKDLHADNVERARAMHTKLEQIHIDTIKVKI